MALASNLAQIGISARHADFLGDTQETGIAATGTTQGAAYAITKSINRVTTATGGANDSLVLPLISTLKAFPIFIKNNSGATINVFPGVGDSITTLAADTAITVADTQGVMLFPVSATNWVDLKA